MPRPELKQIWHRPFWKPWLPIMASAVKNGIACLRKGNRRWRLVKNEFIFYKRNSRLSRTVRYANGCKNVFKLTMQRRRSNPTGNTKKFSLRRPHSVDGVELGHFTLLLFCRGGQRNVQRYITHLHSYCFTNFKSFVFWCCRYRRRHGLLELPNVKFWEQSLGQGHYQPKYQQTRKGFIYVIILPLISYRSA